jgi:hypothetical protein
MAGLRPWTRFRSGTIVLDDHAPMLGKDPASGMSALGFPNQRRGGLGVHPN